MQPAEWGEQITCVEFPGYVNSTTRCLQALGSIPTRTSKKNLSLKLVPEDPICTPMFGNSKNTSSLLLKVSRSQNPSKAFTSKIIGIVDRTIDFRGIADYQIEFNKKKSPEETADELVDSIEGIMNNIDGDEPLPNTYDELDLAIPSICFSKNPPSDYNFRNKSTNKYKVNDKGAIQLLRKKTSRGGCLFEVIKISYHEDIPSYPSPLFANLEEPKLISEIIVQFSSALTQEQVTVLEKLVKLFQDPENDDLHAYSNRPIWLPRTISQFFPASQSALITKLLPAVAYFFTSGPWKGFAVRFGYDPNKDDRARFLQGIQTNIVAIVKKRQSELQDQEETNAGESAPVVDPPVGNKDGDVTMEDASSADNEIEVTTTQNNEDQSNDQPMGEQQESTADLAEGDQLGSQIDLQRRFPYQSKKQIVMYQLCDIECHAIRQLILNSPVGQQPQATSGWYYYDTHKELRSIANERAEFLYYDINALNNIEEPPLQPIVWKHFAAESSNPQTPEEPSVVAQQEPSEQNPVSDVQLSGFLNDFFKMGDLDDFDEFDILGEDSASDGDSDGSDIDR